MVQVQLDLSEPRQHRVAVTLRLEPRLARMRLQLPGWTPGSYLIRDYVRQLEQLSVSQGGEELALQRLSPSCWLVEPDLQGGALEVRYAVMATELSVRTCHIDQDHAFLALAAVVLELEGERWSPHQLQCQLPVGWDLVLPLSGNSCDGWQARDLDQLLDTPLEAGPHRCHSFSVAGVPHQWITWGGPAGADDWLLQRFPQLLGDVARVCESCCRLMGVPQPASSGYLFVLHLLDEAYGGLEHDDSTVLVYGRSNFEKPDGYRKFLQLVAHEYLHQWNVRRLRPAELVPIDYHQPPVVPTLWFAEGITSYVDQFLPLTAGLSSADELLEDLGADLSRFRLVPGRFVQSLRESSQEAWVKLYKADAYSPDSQVSYYLKGAVVALCLDLHLRAAGSSLPAVLQALWQSHGRWRRGYSEQDLIAAFAAGSADLAQLLPQWLSERNDPDLDGYLAGVGLELRSELASSPWAGFSVRADAGRLIVQRVHRGGPAEQAGVMVGDELIGVDQQRLLQSDALHRALRDGAAQELLIARRGQLRSLSLQCRPPALERYRLVRCETASAAALERQRQWLALEPVCGAPC